MPAFIRIVVFYVGGVFVIGLIVPRDADVFIGGSAQHKIAASPFVHGKRDPSVTTVPATEAHPPVSCASIGRQWIGTRDQRNHAGVHLFGC